MTLDKFYSIISSVKSTPRHFLAINFGCRVNAAETNQLSQIFIDQGFIPATPPAIILINTCSITQKGEKESLGKVRQLHRLYPKAIIFVTGCAHLNKITDIPNTFIFKNKFKERLLKDLNCAYTPQIKDKFSHTHRFLLKIQSGCTQYCTYCTVPYRRQYLWSLPIDKAIQTVKKAISDGYQEIIITGVNLDQYQPKLSNLIKNILIETNIKLISFGSLTINTLNQELLDLYQNPNFFPRLSHFLHVPIQSGSDKILKLMNRPYTKKDILNSFNLFKTAKFSLLQGGKSEGQGGLSFGTDIIVGFPNETEKDFLETYKLCQQIGFKKIHTFRFSPRPQTPAKFLAVKSSKLTKEILSNRSKLIRSISQTKPPSHQTPEN